MSETDIENYPAYSGVCKSDRCIALSMLAGFVVGLLGGYMWSGF